MKRDISHVFAFIVVAVASCGGNGSPDEQSLTGGSLTGAGVLLATEKSSYHEGDLIELTIHNQEPVRLAYNACTRTLEVKEGGVWVAGPESLRLCTKDVSFLAAGAIQQDSADLDIGLRPGEYRMVLSFAEDFDPVGQVIHAASNAFTIVP
jgi:hypothetical protein